MSSTSNCPICFDNLTDKIKASPDNCDHTFCLQCLEKWSKLGSYCPVDRKRFKKILNLDSEAVIQVKSHKRKRKRDVYDFTTHCEVCSDSSNANVLLLCDCCDLGYHIHCLSPPLKEVPAGLWFCPTCISVEEKLKKKNGITKEVEAELGGFDNKLLYKTNIKEKVINEKESILTAKKLDNPAPVSKKSSILQTCYDIIAEFEDMTVRKTCSKDSCSSNYLDSAINKIDKIYKTFDIVSKNSKKEQSKSFKTYSSANTYKKQKILKPFDAELGKKSASETINLNTADNCLNENSLSMDFDLQNHHTLTRSETHGSVNKNAPCKNKVFSTNETTFKKPQSKVYNIQGELYSEANALSDKSHGNSSQKRNLKLNSAQRKFEDLKTYGSVNMPVLKKFTEENEPDIPVLDKFAEKNADEYLEKKQSKYNRAVIASCAEDSEPSTSYVRNKSSKEYLNEVDLQNTVKPENNVMNLLNSVISSFVAINVKQNQKVRFNLQKTSKPYIVHIKK